MFLFLLPVEINLTVVHVHDVFFISFKSISIFTKIDCILFECLISKPEIECLYDCLCKMMIKLVIFKLVLNKLLEEVKMTVQYAIYSFPYLNLRLLNQGQTMKKYKLPKPTLQVYYHYSQKTV